MGLKLLSGTDLSPSLSFTKIGSPEQTAESGDLGIQPDFPCVCSDGFVFGTKVIAHLQLRFI